MSGISLKPKQGEPIQHEYGRFLDDFTFELTNPDTPRPWPNLLSNEEYLLSITQLGSGYSCYKSIGGNQVTPNSGFDTTNVGRFFYIRNSDSGTIFSPMVYPAHGNLSEYSNYSCVYAPGSMTWRLSYANINSRLQTLVCPDENTELYLLELTNATDENQTFDCFLYLDWEFGGAPRELGSAINASFDKTLNAQVSDLNIPPQYRFHQTGFITASIPILDYDCRRLAFLGSLGTISKPIAVAKGQCSNSGGPVIGTTCGAVRVRLEIAPGQTQKVMFAVGVVEDASKLGSIVCKYHNPAVFQKNLDKVNEIWSAVFAKQHICEPADTLARFCDTWLKYQVIQKARWGNWAFGKGYRDILQGTFGTRLLDTSRAGEMISQAVACQKHDGHAPRQWSIVPWRKCDWRDYRDSCLWLVYAIDGYLRETGDFEFLDKQLGFVDSDKTCNVWGHMNLAIDYSLTQRGSHGLCLIGQGDWLDSLNQVGIEGKGESVWLSEALCWALLKMIELADATNRTDRLCEYKKRYDELSTAINTTGWDGNWYLRGYNDDGEPIGSADCPDGGKIFLNPQSWAVISGIASPQRIKSAFAAVDEHLATQVGPLLYTPRYSKYDPKIGRITIGASEADAVYVHAVAFKILADFMLGHADAAYETIQQIVPAVRRLPAGQTGAEPFCCVNAYAGAGWSWPGWSYTGWWTSTCDWLLMLTTEYLFGLRSEYNGLKVDPCLPSNWRRARFRRHFRNAFYDVTITKPAGISRGQVSLELDGSRIDGDTLPVLADAKDHKVKCIITA